MNGPENVYAHPRLLDGSYTVYVGKVYHAKDGQWLAYGPVGLDGEYQTQDEAIQRLTTCFYNILDWYGDAGRMASMSSYRTWTKDA